MSIFAFGCYYAQLVIYQLIMRTSTALSGCSLVQKLCKRLRSYVLTRFQRSRTFAHGNVKNRLTWGGKKRNWNNLRVGKSCK